MILFEEDWDKYPEAIIDTSTKNKSFVRLSAVYREMGVKNHAFLLALHNPALQGVDPHDPNLDVDTIVAISIECKNNFWYFIREIARDPDGTPDDPILFEANRGIIAAYWLFFNHITFMLIMIRQTGKSFGIDWLYDYLMNIRLTNADISCLTKDEKLAGREVERLKSMELALPAYLRQRSARDPGNTEVIRISSLNNNFKLYLPNKSPKIADMVGRGMTTGIVGVDEFAYIFNNWITIPVILSSSLAARELAKKKNEPYGIIFGTTSGKRDTPEGRYAYQMMMGSAQFLENFFDARDADHLLEIVKMASLDPKRPRVNCTFNHRQLGKTDEWLAERIATSEQSDPVQIAADFFNEWPSGSTTTPFTREQLQQMRDSEQQSTFLQIAKPEPYAIRWYYPEDRVTQMMEAAPHIIGSDPSQAEGGDSFTYVCINAYTGETAFAIDVQQANIWHLSKWVADFLIQYKRVTLIPERRSMGAALCDYLLLYLTKAGVDPFTRIYNQVVQDKDEYKERYQSILRGQGMRESVQLEYKKLFGFPTSGTGSHSRSTLYSDVLRSAVKMIGSVMRDRKLILQTVALEIRDGRVDHPKGEHDDVTIAWLLAYWLLAMGKNLDHYGLDSSQILTRNQIYQKELKTLSHYDQQRHYQARSDVQRLTKLLEVEKDEYVARRLEYDLEVAISRLTEQDRQVVSADDLIKRLREDRQKNSFQGYVGR